MTTQRRTGVVRLSRLGHHFVRAAHERDVALRRLDRRVLPQVCRVAVEPPQVALVDRLDVVADRAAVAVRVPRVLQGWRQDEPFGYLAADVPLVQHAQLWSCRYA